MEFDFIKCTEGEVREAIDNCSLKHKLWEMVAPKDFIRESSIAEGVKKIVSNGDTLGFIDLVCEGMYGSKSIEISLFEVVHKGKGDGKTIIDWIKNDIPKGYTAVLLADTTGSEEFWIKMGFQEIGSEFRFTK